MAKKKSIDNKQREKEAFWDQIGASPMFEILGLDVRDYDPPFSIKDFERSFTIKGEDVGLLTFTYYPLKAMRELCKFFVDYLHVIEPIVVGDDLMGVTGLSREETELFLRKARVRDTLLYSIRAITLLHDGIANKLDEALQEFIKEIRVQALIESKDKAILQLIDSPIISGRVARISDDYKKLLDDPTGLMNLILQDSIKQKKERMKAPKRGNPGNPSRKRLFKNEDDFLTALKEVLKSSRKKPSAREILHAIRQHPLCLKKTSEYPSQNETKTLRNWLGRCGLNIDEAIRKYYKGQE
jgi:hypothetical protein